MSDPVPLDLARFRRSCADCSVQQLCQPTGADAADMRRLDAVVQRTRPLRKGSSLYRVGDPFGNVFLARSGSFKTVVVSEGGEEHVLGFHLPGELFGLDGVGSGLHRCEAVALGDAQVCELPFDQLAMIAMQLPSLQRQLLQVIGQTTDRDHDHLGVLSRRQASERVALFLLGMSGRFRRMGRPADDFRLPMSRYEIACHLGLVLETVSRGFSRLHEDGLIEVSARHVRILDERMLYAVANGGHGAAAAAGGSANGGCQRA